MNLPRVLNVGNASPIGGQRVLHGADLRLNTPNTPKPRPNASSPHADRLGTGVTLLGAVVVPSDTVCGALVTKKLGAAALTKGCKVSVGLTAAVFAAAFTVQVAAVANAARFKLAQSVSKAATSPPNCTGMLYGDCGGFCTVSVQMACDATGGAQFRFASGMSGTMPIAAACASLEVP